MTTRFTARRITWPVAASITVVAVTLAAVAAPALLAPGDPLAINPAEAFAQPSLAHPFGTDESGRDVLTRVVHGARASVGIGVAATLISAGIGAMGGFAAGLGPRLADRALARLFEVLFALPTLVLALLFISVMGGGTASSVLAIGIATIPGYARMLRARVRGVRSSAYVEWARLDGAGRASVFARHIAPNSLWPLAAAATLGVGQSIIWVSSLGFLGLGTAPPAPEWGAMLNAGRVYLTSAWWMTLFPGLAIVAVASALTVLGRAAGAPRSQGRARSRGWARSRGLASTGSRPAAAYAQTLPGAAGLQVPGLQVPGLQVPGLHVSGLHVTTSNGVPVLEGVALTVAPGECLAIVGESGAGKSVLARTLLGLTQGDPSWRVSASALSLSSNEFAHVDLTHASPRAWRRVRGPGIALVMQDALQSLDPLRTIEAEVGETLAIRGVRGAALRASVVSALERAGLPDGRARLRQRPHELSGGMRQRALIAAALIGSPAVLIADEPTTALDPATSLRVQQQLREIVQGGRGVLLISHDLPSVAHVADRIAVLERGRIVETGGTAQVLSAPQHAATRALVAAIPTGPKPARQHTPSAEPVLQLQGASRSFVAPGGTRAGMFDVDLTLRRGETLGVVGASGAGKTTLGRVIIGAQSPERGTRTLAPGTRVRLIPQDPLASFDPRWRVQRILEASLHRVQRAAAGATAAAGAESPTVATSAAPTTSNDAESPAQLLALVGLDASVLDAHPAQLSGGQRQRVAIARALAARPDVLVCDEAVSALDVTTQQGVLSLLADLQERCNLSIVFISHDLAAVRLVADRTAVMSDGRIVEQGDTEDIIASLAATSPERRDHESASK
ncbi:ATP-binding cassette domain-containing protein [Leucobacter sp. HY1908]